MNKAACVALVDSRIKTIKMVTRKNNQLLGMPGGKLDPGETFREAAIRETFEETGVSLTHEQITEEPIYIGQVGDFEVATFLAFISDDQQFVQKEHGVKTVSLPVSSIAESNLVEFPEYNQYVLDELLKTSEVWEIIHDEKSLCFTEVSISAVENWLQLNSETIEYKQQTISLEHIKCILQHIKESKTSRPNSSIDATWVRVDGDYIEAVSMWDDGTLIKFDNTTKDVK
jgi:8-oxo-dGTP pyrophosphatase MutT (NUDIX family)